MSPMSPALLLPHEGWLIMRKLRFLFLIAVLVLIGSLSGEPSLASSQAGVSLTVSNPTCTQAKDIAGTCYLNLRYLNASSSDPTFSHVEISVDGKVRAFYSTFFESSVYVGNAMQGKGLQVKCGLPNASGDPLYGQQYQVVITAFLADVPSVTDTANVNCPYFLGKNLLPVVTK